jgi:hypothetical protein
VTVPLPELVSPLEAPEPLPVTDAEGVAPPVAVPVAADVSSVLEGRGWPVATGGVGTTGTCMRASQSQFSATQGLRGKTYRSFRCNGRRGWDDRREGCDGSVTWGHRGRRCRRDWDWCRTTTGAIVDHDADARAGCTHVVRRDELVDIDGLTGLRQAGDGRTRRLLEEQEGVLALARLAEAARAGVGHKRLGLRGDSGLHSIRLELVLGEVEHGGVGVGGVEHHDEERDARVDGRLV